MHVHWIFHAELVENINEYSRSLDDISYELEKQVEIYSEIKKQTKSLGDALDRNLKYIKGNKDLSQNLVRIFKEQNNLSEKLVRNKEDLLTGELSSKKVNDDLLKVNTQSLNILLRQRDINDEIERHNKDIEEDQKRRYPPGGGATDMSLGGGEGEPTVVTSNTNTNRSKTPLKNR